MRKEQLKRVNISLIISAIVFIGLFVYFINDGTKRIAFIVLLLLNAAMYLVFGIAIKRLKQREKALAWKPMLNRDVLANLSLDLKVMRFRISHHLVEENAAIYQQFYLSYPDSQAQHEEYCTIHEKEIDRVIDHAVQTYDMNIADVRAYLRNFCYLNAYFKIGI